MRGVQLLGHDQLGLRREINCRRAASAAFQEHVGRQGTFPHGIDILTQADYFTVGHRSNAFTKISIYVAGFPEYREALCDHLVKAQVRHWDKSVRLLSSQTLGILVSTDAARFADEILPKLLDASLSQDLPTRHGSALGVAETVLGLRGCGHVLSKDVSDRVVELVPAIEKARLYR